MLEATLKFIGAVLLFNAFIGGLIAFSMYRQNKDLERREKIYRDQRLAG